MKPETPISIQKKPETLNRERFYSLLNEPHQMLEADEKELELLAREYPYFSHSYILLAKYAYDKQYADYNQKITEASAYVLNRKSLKDYLKELPKLSPPSKLTLQNKEAIGKEEVKEEVLLQERSNNSTPEKVELAPSYSTSTNKASNQEALQPFVNREEESKVSQEEDIKKKEQIAIETLVQKQNQELTQESTKVLLEKIVSTPRPQISIIPVVEEIHFGYSPTRIHKKPVSNRRANTAQRPQRLMSLSDYWAPPKLEDVQAPTKINSTNEFIDYFLSTKPVISKKKIDVNNFENDDLSLNSSTLAATPVSETFALMLEKQGRNEEAIEVYEQLLLKSPEKKLYFAQKIDSIKNIH